MADTRQLTSDLEYVSDVVRRSEGSSPLALYLLWASVVLVGFSLVDLAPRRVGLFWIIAGPLGGIASAFIGRSQGLRLGQLGRAEGIRHAWHWSGMMLVLLMAAALGTTGVVDWSVLSRVFLLIVALAYFLAGVHLERPLKWIGLLMMAGYVALFFVPAYGWTMLGILVAAALVFCGWKENRPDGAQTR